MKKYLLSSGAMLVGAGLMFVLMHGEVNAEGGTERCENLVIPVEKAIRSYESPRHFVYCKIRDLTCVIQQTSTSCVKTKGGIFK
jgi:hypothetical protein